MGTADERQAICVVEVLSNVLSKGVAGPPGRYAPPTTVVRVRPQQVTHWTLCTRVQYMCTVYVYSVCVQCMCTVYVYSVCVCIVCTCTYVCIYMYAPGNNIIYFLEIVFSSQSNPTYVYTQLRIYGTKKLLHHSILSSSHAQNEQLTAPLIQLNYYLYRYVLTYMHMHMHMYMQTLSTM